MVNEPNERPGQLELRAREAFDEHVASLDAHTRSRLNQARHAALDAARNKKRITAPRWLMPAGSVAAMAMIATVTFQYMSGTATVNANKPVVTSAMEYMDIIASNDELDLLQNVDFYEWLDTTDATDGQTS